jgi:hypothetical protein
MVRLLIPGEDHERPWRGRRSPRCWEEGAPARSNVSCAGLTRASRLSWHGPALLIEMAGTTLAAHGGSPGHDDAGPISPGMCCSGEHVREPLAPDPAPV